MICNRFTGLFWLFLFLLGFSAQLTATPEQHCSDNHQFYISKLSHHSANGEGVSYETLVAEEKQDSFEKGYKKLGAYFISFSFHIHIPELVSNSAFGTYTPFILQHRNILQVISVWKI